MTVSHYSIQPGSAFFFTEAGPKTVTSDHPHFNEIVDYLLSGEDPTDLIDVATQINKVFQHGRVKVEDGVLTLDGKPIEDEGLADYVIRMVEEGETDPTPFIQFIESLDRNESRNSRAQLFSFIRANGLTLHEDGRILAYKGVRDDYYDRHSGTFLNVPGVSYSMPRRDIDDNPDNHCSYGFHVAAWKFASDFGSRTMLTATAAEDVVSVPNDHDAQKMRVCCYEVISEVIDGTPVGAPVYRQDDDYEDETSRYRVVLRTLAPGLSGYVTREYELEAEGEADAEDKALDLLCRLLDVSSLDVETVSVTEV